MPGRGRKEREIGSGNLGRPSTGTCGERGAGDGQQIVLAALLH